MSSGRYIWILIAFPILMLLGCTRPEGDTSKIQIVLPQKMVSSKFSAQAADPSSLMHVVINVTGDGLRPILLTWDVCHDCTTPVVPSSFNLEIPMGSNRLIQVLAVYQDSTSHSMSFYYGDGVKSLSQAQESVVIPISSLGASTDVVPGQITGRFLTAANQGPTGPIDIVYTPPGKPSLIIDRSFIVNGWFDVFGLTGLPFGYRLPDGNLLFGKNLDLNDPVLAASQRVLRVGMPAHYRSDNGSNNVITWKMEEPEIHVYGYFGPAADTSFYVCRPSTLNSLTKMAKADSPTGATLLTSSTSAIPAPADLLNTTTPLSSYYVNGGDFSSSLCSSMPAGSKYVSYLKFNPTQIDGNGKDSSGGFQLPFEWNASNTGLTISSSNPRSLSGKVLPGVETVVDTFAAFKRPTTDYNFHLESVDCPAIAFGAMGFVPAGTGAVDAATRNFSLTSNISSAEVTNGVSVVLCPVKGGQMGPQGLFLPRYSFSSGGMMAGPPDHLTITMAASGNQYQCIDAMINVVDANGNQVPATNNITFDLSSLGTHGVEFLPGASMCSTGSATLSTSISAGSSGVNVKVRPGSFTLVNDQVNVANIASASLPPAMVAISKPFVIVGSGVITQLMLDPTTQSRMNPGTCLPLKVMSADTGYNPVTVGTATSFSLSVNPWQTGQTVPIQIYTDAGCAAALPVGANNASFAAATSATTYYMKGSATGSANLSGSLIQNMVIESVSTNVASELKQYVEVVPVGQPTRIQISASFPGTDAFSGNCLPFGLSSKDDAGTAVSVTGNMSLKWSTTSGDGGDFYTDSACSPGNIIATNSTIPWSNQSSQTVYFQPRVGSSVTAVSFTIGAQFSTPAGPGSFMLNGSTLAMIKPVKLDPVLKLSGVAQTPPVTVSYAGAQCLEVALELRDETTSTATANKSGQPLNVTVDFSPTFSSDGQVYTDNACTATTPTPLSYTLGNGAIQTNSYFVKALAGATSQTYQMTYPALPSGIHWVPAGNLFSLAP